MNSRTSAAPHTSGLKTLLLVIFFSLSCLLWLSQQTSWFEASLLALGAALGLTLYHASFGFTTAWRDMLLHRKSKGLRAQMLMLAVAICLFFPVLSLGELAGTAVNGFNRPLGWPVIIGAFMFGIGMQLGNGCASGNLYHAGGGQLRALPSMLGFAIGGVWATTDYEWWTSLPQLAPVSTIEHLGVPLALATNLAVLAAIVLFSLWLEKRRHGYIERDAVDRTRSLLQRLLCGPWPFIWGAIALAVLNFVTLAMIGRPWAVAIAYPLWGAKLSEAIGIELDLDFSTYWLQPGRDDALLEPLINDPATLMNGGVILGALLAAALAGKLVLQWRMPWQHGVAASLGGLLLGYGATISFGCNIGAYVGGVISGSLHGWLWLVAALLGNRVGTILRPLFKLTNAS